MRTKEEVERALQLMTLLANRQIIWSEHSENQTENIALEADRFLSALLWVLGQPSVFGYNLESVEEALANSSAAIVTAVVPTERKLQ